MAALRSRRRHYIFILWFLLSSFFLPFFLSYSQPSQIGRLPYCGLSANLGCRSKTCCTRLIENTARSSLKILDAKIAQYSPSAQHRTTLLGYIFATKARIDNQKISPPHVLTIWWTSAH